MHALSTNLGLSHSNTMRDWLFGQLCIVALATVFGLGTGREAAAGCDEQSASCKTEAGSYHIELPGERAAGATPAVIFLHGYGGSGQGSLRNRSLIQGLTDRGYAVIAPDALPWRGDKRSWNFFPGWQGRDEEHFLREVASDAADRFDLDRNSMVLAGFSAGAFMVNYLACSDPNAFAAYAPVSGGFWRPQPEKCAGPIRLFQTHGWSDTVVPLEGRFLGGGEFQQGDIFAGLELWRRTNNCSDQAPDQLSAARSEMRRRWSCENGNEIDFVLFPEGHRVPNGWADWLIDWLETESPAKG